MELYKSLFTNVNEPIVSGLTNELKLLYILDKFKKEKSAVVVAASLYEANKIYQGLKNYTDDVVLFPMDEFLTSEVLALSPDFKMTRLETINKLLENPQKIVVANLMGYLRFLPDPSLFKSKILKLSINQDYNIDELKKTLYSIGYTKEVTVNKTGEIAIRGFIIDIFPINNENPIRIEFWGDTIDSIREFDIDSQLSKNSINTIEIFPNTELLLENDVDTFELKQRDLIMYSVPKSIIDYQSKPVIFLNDYEQLSVSYNLLLEEIFNYKVANEISSTVKFMHELDDFQKGIIKFAKFDIDLKNPSYISKEIKPFIDLSEIKQRLKQHLVHKETVVLALSTRYQANKIIDELPELEPILTNENNIFEEKLNIIIKKIQSGFIFNNLVLISENELFNKKEQSSFYKTNFKFGTRIKDITKLNLGDYIVHSSYGIGRYLGLKTITKNGLKKDYLQIEYKDNDKLYIPAERIEFISKFSSADGSVPKINKLGTTDWEKTKLKARKRAQDIAQELLELYAKREASHGFQFLEDDMNQVEFEKEFPYKETNDQLKVISEIKKDMQSTIPMDRLLCGDVGYGKTEVAFRAIFKAILSGKQTALLCPTTILSNQHYKNAIERFKSFPVRIEILNRFVSSRKAKIVLNDLKDGKVDLLIGTHRILSEDVQFKNLGLLVVDEEQRFGVIHKEKIKKYKNNIDILTLSATPIPRTLQMSMTGVRNLSLIETPPVNRLPIQTYVIEENNNIVKDAIYKELSREGQAFILYNYIDDIKEKAMEISRLVPDAKVIYAHGKMPKSELEEIMFKFINKEYDILLCTTIIETGIDIPNVNTLIIIDADKFGLSQLYQIRGRVGRTNKIAYCYLMYNKHKILSEIAIKRLKAIKEFTELGSGFAIAMRDLSIRGAGDMLGSEQAGFIDSVGIDLFMKMLNEETERLKGNEVLEEKPVQPLLDVVTHIDDNYIKDNDLKIEIHKMISEIDSLSKLQDIKIQLEDRFGKIDENLIIYMHEQWLEKELTELELKSITQTKNFIELMLPSDLASKIQIDKLFIQAMNLSRMFRFSSRGNNVIITLDTVKLEKHFVYYLLDLVEILKRNLK